MKSICVFCGSSPGRHPEFLRAAKNLGQTLASQELRLVYGGASVGLMGAVADAVLDNGGEVIGVIPEHLFSKEVAHQNLKDLRIVKSMHERKALMADLSDAFIALPGGFGTFEEFFEILTWSQLGLHRKPAGLLDVDDYYKALMDLIKRGLDDEFIRPEHGDLVLRSTSAEDLLSKFRKWVPPALPKWMNKSQT